MKHHHFSLILLAISILGGYGNIHGKNYSEYLDVATNDLILHYDKPAEFFEEALVIGNGKLGGIVYGGVKCDSISLNDITLWSGMPDTIKYSHDFKTVLSSIRTALDKEDYVTADNLNRSLQGHYSENYQPLGCLYIRYNDPDMTDSQIDRSLDISHSVAMTSGSGLLREYLASSPDSIIALKIESKNNRGLNLSVDMSSKLPNSVTVSDNEITVDGYAAYHSFPVYYGALADSLKHQYDPNKGVHFRTVIHIEAPESQVKTKGKGISVEGGRYAIVYISNETSFNGYNKNPVAEGKQYLNVAKANIDKAISIGYESVKKRHIIDYRSLFDRVKLDLGRTEPEISAQPTDIQLKNYTLFGQKNPELEVLYFQYGRYLLISSSRTKGVPANLQGLWNESLLPPWSCNYTTNINLSENYWGANVTNLAELHMPLIEFIENLAVNGAKTAKTFYNVNQGWCLGHNTDIWAMTNPVGLQSGDPVWASWNMGGAWLASHIWTHYQFTQDRIFLEKYYPYLKDAAEFCLGWMIEKDGKLLTSPGTSPENKFYTPDGLATSTSYGTTSDLAMIRQCLGDAIKAAEVLGYDPSFVTKAQTALSKLSPYKIDERGALQEWYHPFKETDPNHRHQSHLYGLYPGSHITLKGTPKLAAAAHESLKLRGSESTGWSTGWRVNLYARLQDADMAYRTYRKLLKYISPNKYTGKDAIRGGGTYPNRLDAHSPFQIDGNFGGSAGVAEMLIQSDDNSITLLPALPTQWNTGTVKGLKARGGFTVDFQWDRCKATRAVIYSATGGSTNLIANGKIYKIKLDADSEKVLQL